MQGLSTYVAGSNGTDFVSTQCYRFVVAGYVVMTEHYSSLLTEPEVGCGRQSGAPAFVVTAAEVEGWLSAFCQNQSLIMKRYEWVHLHGPASWE
jgi:hypothetical protein